MKILKYIFLLLLLSFVALTVFVATQKGDFDVERSKVINSPKTTVYNYVNDFRNYGDFESWALEDPTIKMSYSAITIGNGAAFSWIGDAGSGNASIVKSTEGEKIQQRLNLDGTESDVNWIFKDTLVGKTKVTWKAKGTMSFWFKIYTALNGGADNIIGTISEKSLANIDKKLDFEANTFSIKVNGLVKKTETFYIKQTFTSEIQKVYKNAAVVIPKLLEFSKTNNLYANGKPFIIYHTYDVAKGLAKISICLPISKEIMTSMGSDILSGKLNAFDGVKTTLKGDYTHNNDAIAQTNAFVKKEGFVADLSWSHLEVLNISKLDEKNSSKLETEFYYPVKPKVVPVVAAPVSYNATEGTVSKQPQPKRAEKAPVKKAQEEETSEFEL